MRRFSAMRIGARPVSFWRGFLVECFFLTAIPSALAAITPTGDVEPSDPSTWTSSTQAYIGNTASGILTVDGGSILRSSYSYIGYSSGVSGLVTVSGNGSEWTDNSIVCVGYNGSGSLSISNGGRVVSNGSAYIGDSSGSSGTVTVSGIGSSWTGGGYLYVGYNGSGNLAISGGGAVKVSDTTWVGYAGTSSGAIYFGDGGGTLTTNGLVTAGSNLTGAGTISTRGIVSDVNPTFDGSAIWSGAIGTAGTATVDMRATSGNGPLGVGYAGTGTLTIRNGAQVYSGYGYLGYLPGSSGTATVSGSTWTSSGCLYIGFNGNGSLSISNGATVSNNNAYIGNYSGSSGTVTVSGSGSTWTNVADLYVGNSGSGTLAISSGGAVTVAARTYVAYAGANTGTINFGIGGGTLTTNVLWARASDLQGIGTIMTKGIVSDLNLTFDGSAIWTGTFGTAGTATVDMSAANPIWCSALGAGYAGAATLIIKNGAKVYSGDGYLGYMNGSSGTATVSGIGSTWNNAFLSVGWQGNGSLSISNGGTVSGISAPYEAVIGYLSGSSGTVAVSGTGSTWTDGGYGGELFIGYQGSGSLSINNGGTVTDSSNSNAYIGYSSGSSGTVTVSGAGSTWTSSGTLSVGKQGSGSLSISNGGAVHAGKGYIGFSSGSWGAVTVSDTISTWTNAGNVYVGYGGDGTVTQMDGTVLVGGILSLGGNSGVTGVYNLNGGVLAVHGLASGSGTAAFKFGGGTLRPDADFASSLPMTLTGTGGNAAVNTNSHAVSLSGVLSGVGGLTKTGSGTLTLSGANNYSGTTTVASGVLRLVGTSIAAPRAWNPVLNLAGADIQSGKLIFDYTGGTDPISTIKAMLAASYDGGRWDEGQIRDSTAASAGLTLGYIDDPVAKTVTVMATYAGDFNLDGVVNNQDKAIWFAHAFTGTAWQQGDANYDGAVDGLDRDLILAYMGLPSISGMPGATGVSPVPEPGTLLLLAAGLLGLPVFAQRQRKLGA